MDIDAKYKQILDIVKSELSCSVHNLDHVFRVYNLCISIAQDEKDVDFDILIPSALLHDIARTKEFEDKTNKTDHAILGAEMSECILKNLGYTEEMIDKIKHCIITHRFRNGNIPQTIEAKILYDADKLDAIGAIGIARAFMYGGKSEQPLGATDTLEDYEAGICTHTPIIEYHIKLKKIPDKLYTAKAKEIGYSRLHIMESFFEQLKLEANGLK